MTIQLPANVCFNRGCQRPLNNGKNTGGFKSIKTRNGTTTGYTGFATKVKNSGDLRSRKNTLGAETKRG